MFDISVYSRKTFFKQPYIKMDFVGGDIDKPFPFVIFKLKGVELEPDHGSFTFIVSQREFSALKGVLRKRVNLKTLETQKSFYKIVLSDQNHDKDFYVDKKNSLKIFFKSIKRNLSNNSSQLDISMVLDNIERRIDYMHLE